MRKWFKNRIMLICLVLYYCLNCPKKKTEVSFDAFKYITLGFKVNILLHGLKGPPLSFILLEHSK